MDRKEFSYFRNKLNKTQQQIAQLLGTSQKAIQGYEQGWRNVPVHVERQLFFLISRTKENRKNRKPCWVTRNCPAEHRHQCPAWEFRAGKLCWLINGTICEGEIRKNWYEKVKICRSCEVLSSLLRI
jgi:DNA-binding XRE family transcriptional regulator